MSQRQWKRLDAVERMARGALTSAEVAQVLGLSMRQVRRLRRAVEQHGAAGVIHGNSGRAPQHRISAALRKRIVELRGKTYAGFNDHHFTEKLWALARRDRDLPVECAADLAGGGNWAPAQAAGGPASAPARAQTASRADGAMGWQPARLAGRPGTDAVSDGGGG